MKRSLIALGFLGISPLLGALACSGKNINDLGDVNSGGHAGVSGALSFAGEGDDVGIAGAPDPMTEVGGAAGSMTTPVAGSANGGAAGTPDIVETDGGAAGAAGAAGVVFQCPTCTVVADDQDVRSVTVSGGKVYWVDYGKYDHLGNYDYNGRLFSRDISGGAQTLIVDGLAGPEEVSVSGSYAYVLIDHRTQPNLPQGLLRVPLAGGTPVEISTSSVNDYVTLPRLSAAPGYEFWVLNAGIVRAANAADATKEVVLAPRGVEQITNDGTTLFFRDSKGLWAMPLAGGDPVQLYAYPDSLFPNSFNLVVSGAYLYSLEIPEHTTDTAHYLIRMPKTGGAWTRLADTEPNLSELAVDGERLFVGGYPYTGDRFNLYQSTLSAPETKQWFLTDTAVRRWSWAVVPSGGVFYGDDHALYFTTGAP